MSNVEKMEILDFQEVIGLNLLMMEDIKSKTESSFHVKFNQVTRVRGGIKEHVCGHGETIDDAIINYASLIENRVLLIQDGEQAREITSPRLKHTKQVDPKQIKDILDVRLSDINGMPNILDENTVNNLADALAEQEPQHGYAVSKFARVVFDCINNSRKYKYKKIYLHDSEGNITDKIDYVKSNIFLEEDSQKRMNIYQLIKLMCNLDILYVNKWYDDKDYRVISYKVTR